METETKKSFINNTLFNVIYKISNVIFPLIISIYTSRVLLPEGIGKVASAQNIVSYFTLVAALGIPNYGIREIAKVTSSEKKRNQVFSELFVLNFISTSICVMLYYIMILYIEFFHANRFLYIVSGISIILNYISVDWFYYGCEQFSYIAIRNIVVKIFLALCVIIFVKEQEDYIKYAFISGIVSAGNNVFNWIHLKRYHVSLQFFDISIARHFRPIFTMLATVISIEIYTLVDTTMLSVLCSEEVVGYYASSSKIIRVIVILLTALGGALLPRLTEYYHKGRKEECENLINQVFNYIFFLAVPCGIGMFFVSEYMVLIFYGEAFREAAATVKIFSFLLYVLTFSNLFGTQVLLTVNEEKKLLIATVIGAVLNVTLNAFLIPMYMQNGAATASVISETVVTIITFIYARKYFNIRLLNRNMIATFLSSLFMIIVLSIINHCVNGNIKKMILMIVFGTLSYFLCSIASNNPMTKIIKRGS